MNKDKIIQDFKSLSKQQLTEKFSFFSITGNILMMNVILDNKELQENIQFKSKEDVLDKIIKNGHTEAFKLVDEKLLKIKNKDALYYCSAVAVGNNQLEIVKYLMDKSIEINKENPTTILNFIKVGITRCYPELTDYLLSIQDENMYLKLDRNIISDLYSNGDKALPIIKILEKYNYDFKVYDDIGTIMSAQNGAIELLKYFINNGEDTDKALEVSSQGNHTEVIKFLIDSGADVKIDKNIVIRNAAKHNNLEIVKYAVERGADIEYGISNTIAYYNKEVFNYLINYGTDKEKKLNRNKALEISCRRENLPFIKELIEIGGNFLTVEKLMDNKSDIFLELKEYYIALNKDKLDKTLPIKLEASSMKKKI